ncbi:hypothetical protein MBM_03069 [Drepanopeziza brunnea f. sp. 'multigermtubi' MB_m1]|uniref:Uncharacterized protein n=1 Tax=Marssonina brunnea f. sp. multigermtubi (strain MB_m1) TaxID=1072389 RepID=K1X1C8_MARBU|nr:uncharacterized protein MBM_03069 [Drepanopeziza brunnea f. sp. 'multigermtubi' MB_m1]EKD18827.1 hypothetical protein MBM_03069 [Drepanopeziza brunnea f. sp. 'multigermtubi' MB_m1]
MADRATRPLGGESSRQGAVGYYTSRVLSPLTEPLAIQLKGLLYPRLLSFSEGLDDEMSGILFDLNELLYARLDSEITARAIVNDFLDANLKEHLLFKGVWCPLKQRGYANGMEIKEQQATPLGLDSRWTAENLTDDEDNTLQLPPPPPRSPKGKEKEVSRREGEEIRRLREEFAKERRNMEQNMEVMARQMAELRTYAIQSNEGLRRSTSAYSTLLIQQPLRNTPIIQEPKSPQRPLNPFLKSYNRVFQNPGPSSNNNGPENIIGPNNTQGNSSYTPKEDPPKPESIPDKISSRQGQRADFPGALAGDPNDLSDFGDDRRGGNGGDWQGDRGHGYGRGRNGPFGLLRRFGNGPLKDSGSGNKPLRDFGRGRTTGNYIGNLVPIRPLARHGTLAYGTLSAFDDDGDDFLELGATDPYLRAKELALFARSFLKELNRYGLISDDYLAAFLIMLTEEAITFYYNYVIKARLPTFKTNAIAEISLDLVKKENLRTSLSECFKKLAKELKGIQGSLRPGLRDDRSLADKLYSHALEADSDLDEEYECFIQDRQYFGSKKAAKATKGEKRCFVCKKPGCWSTNYTLDERKASVAKF